MSDTAPTTPDVLGSDIPESTEPQVTAAVEMDQAWLARADQARNEGFASAEEVDAILVLPVTAQGLLADLCAELRIQGRGISHRIESLLTKAADHFGV